MTELAVVLANPRAGGGRAGEAARRACAALEAAGRPFERLTTSGPGDAEHLARELPAEVTRLAVAGGDGTLWEVVNGLVARDAPVPPIAVLPCGTGDALAHDLGLHTVLDGVRALLSGTVRRIDLARVDLDGRTFVAFSVVGWGAFARINRRAERLRWCGKRRYDLASLLELASTRTGAPGPLLGAACLTRTTGHRLLLAPDARLDDGLLQHVTVLRGPRRRLLALLRRIARGAPIDSPLVRTAAVRRLDVDLGDDPWAVLDGEAIRANHVQIEAWERALPVLVGENQPGGESG